MGRWGGWATFFTLPEPVFQQTLDLGASLSYSSLICWGPAFIWVRYGPVSSPRLLQFPSLSEPVNSSLQQVPLGTAALDWLTQEIQYFSCVSLFPVPACLAGYSSQGQHTHVGNLGGVPPPMPATACKAKQVRWWVAGPKRRYCSIPGSSLSWGSFWERSAFPHCLEDHGKRCE